MVDIIQLLTVLKELKSMVIFVGHQNLMINEKISNFLSITPIVKGAVSFLNMFTDLVFTILYIAIIGL